MDQQSSAAPLLVRLLIDFREFQPRPGESGEDTATRWLSESALGRRLTGYLGEEASLAAAASGRLSLTDDDELREIGSEIGRSAQRIWSLIGVPVGESS